MLVQIMMTMLLFVCLLISSNGVSTQQNAHRFGDGETLLSVEEIKGYPKPRDFFEKYVFPSKPVKMTETAILSEAYTLWSDVYFQSLCNDSEIAESEITIKTKESEKRPLYLELTSFKEFIYSYNDTDWYMFNPVPSFLRKQVVLPGPLQCRDIMKDHLTEEIMWFSNGGTNSVVHADPADNIICMFRGQKHFVMVNPEKYHLQVELDHPDHDYSEIDWDNVDYVKYPGLKDVEYYHVNITAGDCLYVPYRWFHHVRSHNSNLAINIWWDYHRNHEIDLDQCSTKFDREITFDKLDGLNSLGLSTSIGFLRDRMYQLSSRVNDLSYTKFEDLMHKVYQQVPNYIWGESSNKYFQQIFNTLDGNNDNILHVDEVLVVSAETWKSVQEDIKLMEEDLIQTFSMLDEEEPIEKQEL